MGRETRGWRFRVALLPHNDVVERHVRFCLAVSLSTNHKDLRECPRDSLPQLVRCKQSALRPHHILHLSIIEPDAAVAPAPQYVQPIELLAGCRDGRVPRDVGGVSIWTVQADRILDAGAKE